jgi:hypothetical protein
MTKRVASSIVMPGLDPGIHAFLLPRAKNVDGRVEPGHDEWSDKFRLSPG